MMLETSDDPKSPGQDNHINTLLEGLLSRDPYLRPYKKTIGRRLLKAMETEFRLTRGETSLADFAAGHEYFGLHLRNDEWVLREWAPNATRICLIGDMTNWREKKDFALHRISQDGHWEIRLSQDKLKHGDHYRLRIHWPGGEGDRIPAYSRRVVQDPDTLIFNAQVWSPSDPYRWKCMDFQSPTAPIFVYEAHVGMAQEEEKIGSYKEFTTQILPRIAATGYNTLQLMAIQEHPYYGSFGYQVSNFFAASSRFGTPEELKALIDTAHAAGLRVIMDLVHSHGVSNEF
jgi:1,4-alpha-glucan branching enzyme